VVERERERDMREENSHLARQAQVSGWVGQLLVRVWRHLPPLVLCNLVSLGKDVLSKRRTNLENTGLISTDRSNKATLLLTIPCFKIKVVCNGFIFSNIWNCNPGAGRKASSYQGPTNLSCPSAMILKGFLPAKREKTPYLYITFTLEKVDIVAF
jgi:hypothetical protein